MAMRDEAMTTIEKLSRRQRERLQHRNEILAVALRLFAEKGFHSVSMQEIAGEAEFATGTLYNFFTSKEAMFDELKRDCAEKILGSLGAILDGPGDEVERLRRFFRHQMFVLEEHGEFIRLYVAEFGQQGAGIRKDPDGDELSRVLDGKTEQLLRDGIEKGIFRNVDPAITARAIHATLQRLIFDAVGNPNNEEVEGMFREVERLFLGGLLMPEGERNE